MTIWARVLVAFMLVGAWGGMVGFHGDITQLTDQQIESAIKQRLAMDGRIDATNNHVKVEQEKAAASVKGVKSVTNLVEVVGKPRPDNEIEKDVVTYLQWSPLVELDAIDYKVENAVVKLKGSVDHLAHKYALASDLEKIRGVIDVDVSGVSVTKAQKKAQGSGLS